MVVVQCRHVNGGAHSNRQEEVPQPHRPPRCQGIVVPDDPMVRLFDRTRSVIAGDQRNDPVRIQSRG